MHPHLGHTFLSLLVSSPLPRFCSLIEPCVAFTAPPIHTIRIPTTTRNNPSSTSIIPNAMCKTKLAPSLPAIVASNTIPNINDIKYLSKEEVKEKMMKENETYNKIMSEWKEDENPLQAYFIVTVSDVKSIGETASTIKNLESVDVTKYGEGMVEDLISTFEIVKRVTIIAVIALTFVTAFLISNTIKITIYSRRNEIDIMRLVGTSNTVIRLPFIFEGFFLGIIGSIIPILATIYGYVFLYERMVVILFTPIISLIKPYNFVFEVSAFLLIVGAVVGMFGSYKAVRKYLKI